jgi:hypothetical protein
LPVTQTLEGTLGIDCAAFWVDVAALGDYELVDEAPKHVHSALTPVLSPERFPIGHSLVQVRRSWQCGHTQAHNKVISNVSQRELKQGGAVYDQGRDGTDEGLEDISKDLVGRGERLSAVQEECTKPLLGAAFGKMIITDQHGTSIGQLALRGQVRRGEDL